ncbi:hypothetical protein C1645_746603, partial [Glomus cerebriforme]
MNLPKLPSKCVECIIKHIDENDIKTLHSTTLVNRDWCKFSVIRLWKTPLSFSNLISNLNSNSKLESKSNSINSTTNLTKYPFNNFYKIIPILLSFLDVNFQKDLNNLSKQFYIPKNTLNFYPKLQYDLKIPIDDLKIPTHTILSFDYPKYIKHVNFVDLVVLANKWLNNLLSETLSSSSIFLNFYLYKSLGRWDYIRYMTNSINFHCPFIHFDKNPQIFFKFILESLFKVLFNYSQINSLSIMDVSVTHHPCNQLNRLDHNHFLSNLTSFSFCQTIDSGLLKKISGLIHDTITTISISIVSDESFVDVIDFINSLHSLQSISILGNNTNVTSIIQSLQNHTSTLIKLKLNLCIIDDDAIESLSECDHLQELIFHQLHFTFDDEIDNISMNYLYFPQLKKLNYWEY